MARKSRGSAQAEPSLSDQLRGVLSEAIDNGWSVNGIAKASGVPQPVLQRFIAGVRTTMKSDTMEKLANHFGMRFTRATRNVRRQT